MGAYSKLGAINHMLINAGTSPVTDLVTESGIDVGIALQTLNDTKLDFQLRGLASNWGYVEQEPDENGQLLLPTGDTDDEGIISADLLSDHTSDKFSVPLRIAARVQYDVSGTGSGGGTLPRLYNVTEDTDVWEEGTYKIRFYKNLKWEILDTPLQRAIMATAARRYQMYLQGDPDADAFLAREEQYYMIKARASDIVDRNISIFNTGPAPVQRVGARRTFRGSGYIRFPQY